MSEQEILVKIEALAGKVFRREPLGLSLETTATDVPEWDSITHMQLIMTVEKEFKFRFNMSEIARLENVGDLVNVIQSKV